MSIAIECSNGTRAVLVRLSSNAPVYCAALGRAVPYAVMIAGVPGGHTEIFDLDGKELRRDLVPLGLALAAEPDVLEWFQYHWKKI